MTDTVSPKVGRYYRTREGVIRGPMSAAFTGFVDGDRVDAGDHFDWYDDGRFSHFHPEHKLDLVAEVEFVDSVAIDSVYLSDPTASGPVREVVIIKRELVRGDYGLFHVGSQQDEMIHITFLNDGNDPTESQWLNADELRASADLFNKLADYLENNSK